MGCVIVHEATVGQDVALGLGKVLEVQLDGCDAILGYYLRLYFLLAVKHGLANTGNKYVIAGEVVERLVAYS